MRILLLNQTWFADELRQMGHEVLSCGTAPHLEHVLTVPTIHIDSLIASLPNGFLPDRIVWHDNSAPLTILGLEDCSIPSVMYSVDTHHHFKLHSYLASSFDHILIAQKDLMSHFGTRQTPCSWFPLWASEYMDSSLEKTYCAVFVGTLNRNFNPERVDFFEKLQELTPITVTQGHFPSIFPFAEIVVNQAVRGDLNFRVFEAMMSGALLLTETAGNGLRDLFQDGQHLVTYTPRDPHDAAQKIKALLNDLPRTREIAARGRAEVLAKHLSKHRAHTLAELLLCLQKRPRDPRRHYGALINLHILSSRLEKFSPGYAFHLLQHALECARKALSERAEPDTAEEMHTARVCLQHDLYSGKSVGIELIHALAEAFPTAKIFALLKIRSLLNHGLTAQAREYASRVFTHAPIEQTFSTAEEAVHVVMQQE